MKVFYLFILLTSSFLFAQNINLKLIKTETERFPNVSSGLQVYDNYDEPITDLKPENFIVTLSGKYADSIKITTYKQSGAGIKIVLCIDVSKTMVGEPFNALKKAVNKYIDELRNTDRVAVYTFGDDVTMLSDFSGDKQYLKDIINKIKPDGNYTELYSGLYKAVKKLADDKDKEGKIVVVISDGKDESKTNTYSDKDVIDLAKENGIPVFAIGYTKIDKIYLQSLEKISDNTNGRYYYSPDEENLEKQYKKMNNQIQNIYLLNYTFFDFAGDGNEHTHTVTVTKNGSAKSVSNKVLIPGGIAPVKKQEILIKADENYIIYYVIGGVGLVAVVFLFIVLSKKKKKAVEEISQPQAGISESIKDSSESEPLVIKQEVEENTGDKTAIYLDKTEISEISDLSGERTVILGHEPAVARLDFKIGSLAGQSFSLNQNVFKIGRRQDNDLIIDDKTVSGYHSEIHFDGKNYTIVDKGSTNGTYVNGNKISQQRLFSGDTIKIGSNEAYFIG